MPKTKFRNPRNYTFEFASPLKASVKDFEAALKPRYHTKIMKDKNTYFLFRKLKNSEPL